MIKKRYFLPAPYELIALVWVIAGFLILESLPISYPIGQMIQQAFRSFWQFVVLSAVICAFAFLYEHSREKKQENKTQRLRRNFSDPIFWLDLLRISVASMFTMLFYFLLKSSVYAINPSNWDQFLFRLDQWIHFGIAPSIFFVQLLNNPIIFGFVDVTYSILFFFINLCYPAILLALASGHVRRAFATAYILLWVIGTIGYIALPSWGPVYTYPEEFQDALRYMPATAKVQYRLHQETVSLIQDPLGKRVIIYGGIAAFPSLHIALIALFTLVSKTISKRWFRINVALLIVYVLGSLVTGYHYLIDDYAGLIMAWGFYKIGSYLTARWEKSVGLIEETRTPEITAV